MFLKTHMCTYLFQKMVANCNEADCVRVAICSTLVCCQLKKHLSLVLVSNGYPSSFVVKLAKTPRVTANKEPALGFKSTAVLPLHNGCIKGSSRLPTTSRHSDHSQVLHNAKVSPSAT